MARRQNPRAFPRRVRDVADLSRLASGRRPMENDAKGMEPGKNSFCASGKPFRPSTSATRMSPTRRSGPRSHSSCIRYAARPPERKNGMTCPSFVARPGRWLDIFGPRNRPQRPPAPPCRRRRTRGLCRWPAIAARPASGRPRIRIPANGGSDMNDAGLRIRRQTAEHPFRTIEAWMGATHFSLRTLKKVSEMSLHFLAYNLNAMIPSSGCSRSSRR
jgi:hypothetical protein